LCQEKKFVTSSNIPKQLSIKRDLETHFLQVYIVNGLKTLMFQRHDCKDQIQTANVFQAKYLQIRRERFKETQFFFVLRPIGINSKCLIKTSEAAMTTDNTSMQHLCLSHHVSPCLSSGVSQKTCFV